MARILDRLLRKLGLVRVSCLPFRKFVVTHHHPKGWGEKVDKPITIEGILRTGNRFTGEVIDFGGDFIGPVFGPYGNPNVFQPIDRTEKRNG